MSYSVSRWNLHLFITTGSLAFLSDLYTVCLGGISICLSLLALLLYILKDLHGVSVRSFFKVYLLKVYLLRYSVSQWNLYVYLPLDAFEIIMSWLAGRCLKPGRPYYLWGRPTADFENEQDPVLLLPPPPGEELKRLLDLAWLSSAR